MANESLFQGEDIQMTNIMQFAESVTGGAYDHLLPRRGDKNSLTIRQIAAQYNEIHKKAHDDACVTARRVSAPCGILMGVIAFLLQILIPSFFFGKTVELVFVDFFLPVCVTVILSRLMIYLWVRRTAEKNSWHHSQVTLNKHRILLLMIYKDLSTLAIALGHDSYEALQGYDRKTIAQKAHNVGGDLCANVKHLMNSNDQDERKEAEVYRHKLDKFHALLERLGLQPKGGFPAYGRLAAEAA